MNNRIKFILITLFLFILLFCEGCTVVGYRMGEDKDFNRPYEAEEYYLPDGSVLLRLNEIVKVRLKTGEEYYGRILMTRETGQIDYDLIIKYSEAVISINYDEIELLQIIKNPKSARWLYTLGGCALDGVINVVLRVAAEALYIRTKILWW
jgi:hypothetical protein